MALLNTLIIDLSVLTYSSAKMIFLFLHVFDKRESHPHVHSQAMS